MSTFVLLHGAGDVGWYWHLVERELRAAGHDTVAPDLSGGLAEQTDAVVAAVGGRADLVVVAQSFAGFVGPLVADRLAADALVLLAAMVPTPGESPDDWWAGTGHAAAVRAQAALDGGLTGNADPLVCFYHDVPPELAAEAMRRERPEPSGASFDAPWPLAAWPDVPTRYVLCTEDRLFPAPFARRVLAERLGIVPDEIDAGHCVALSRPVQLAELLVRCGQEER